MELYLHYRWRELAEAAHARPYWLDDVAAQRPAAGLRRVVGQALISLGRAITAEPAPVGRMASVGRQ